jgi:hypothetical protein
MTYTVHPKRGQYCTPIGGQCSTPFDTYRECKEKRDYRKGEGVSKIGNNSCSLQDEFLYWLWRAYHL